VFEVVIMIGRARDGCASPWAILFGGEVPRGPFGDVVRERRIAGEERELAFCRSAPARSFSCIKLVSIERRETRFGFESTR
jgi:hypothetical protein